MKRNGETGIEGGMHVAVILIMAMALCVPLLTLAGCGKDEAREEVVQAREEGTKAGGASAGEGAAETAALETPGGGEEEGESAEGTSGGGDSSFSFETQTLGASGGYPGFDVFDVRWSDHGGYFRIVFELRGHDGAALDRVPICETYYPDGTETPGDMRRLGIRLVGFYDLLDAELRPAHATVSTGDEVVTDITNKGILAPLTPCTSG